MWGAPGTAVLKTLLGPKGSACVRSTLSRPLALMCDCKIYIVGLFPRNLQMTQRLVYGLPVMKNTDHCCLGKHREVLRVIEAVALICSVTLQAKP